MGSTIFRLVFFTHQARRLEISLRSRPDSWAGARVASSVHARFHLWVPCASRYWIVCTFCGVQFLVSSALTISSSAFYSTQGCEMYLRLPVFSLCNRGLNLWQTTVIDSPRGATVYSTCQWGHRSPEFQSRFGMSGHSADSCGSCEWDLAARTLEFSGLCRRFSVWGGLYRRHFFRVYRRLF